MRILAGGLVPMLVPVVVPVLLLAACSSESGSSAGPEPAPSTVSSYDGPVVDLNVVCTGEGSPTIVLIAGLNTSGDVFTDLAGRLSPTTRTCWYDRSGIGASAPLDPTYPDPTPRAAAMDLNASLSEQGIEPPYVVLGWSYGGLVAQAFAMDHPGRLAGLVLEDTSVREQFTDPQLMNVDEEVGVHWSEGGREIDTADLIGQLADLVIPDVPLVVLSQDARGAWGRSWLAFHDELARLTADGIHVVGTRSGHVMHEDVPDLLVAAVQSVWQAAEQGSPLGPCDARFTDVGGRCRSLPRF